MSQHCGKELLNRLAAAEGHIASIRRMLTEDRPCEDILLQISAVEGAIRKTGKILLREHLNSCVKTGIEHGDAGVLERFNELLDKFT